MTNVFLRCLCVTVCELIGSASLDAKMNGKIALRTMIYFVSTSFVNAILGVILVTLIHPGDPSIKGQMGAMTHMMDERKNTLTDNFLDLGRYNWLYYSFCLKNHFLAIIGIKHSAKLLLCDEKSVKMTLLRENVFVWLTDLTVLISLFIYQISAT